MYDIEMRMNNRPGELARIGQALGHAGVSVEGGGMFLAGEVGVAHFLVDGPDTARAALTRAGIEVAAIREPLTLRLDQDQPGQLGALTGAMAEAGVNIEALYSDHDHQLILLVDDPATAHQVRNQWMATRPSATRTSTR